MDLSNIFANFGDDPWANLASVMNGGATLGRAAQQIAQPIANIAAANQGAQTANNVNQQVQQGLGQNAAALQQQIDSLTGQINTNRQQAQDMYQRSLQDVTGQNTGLEGNIGTMTANLNALSDPNSAYMQQARAAIERKDAAAGRRSQWGERETQLAGTLADYVGKYSPSINQSITQARNQINQNNQGLASLYAQANAPADRNMLAQIQAIQQQLANVNAQNTTGRQAQNSATNNTANQIPAAIGGISSGLQGVGGLLGGLKDLFGGSNNNGSYLSSGQMGGYGFGAYGGLGQGFTGGALDNDYLGLAGTSSLDQGMSAFTNPYNFQSAIGNYPGGSPMYEPQLDFNDPDSGWWD